MKQGVAARNLSGEACMCGLRDSPTPAPQFRRPPNHVNLPVAMTTRYFGMVVPLGLRVPLNRERTDGRKKSIVVLVMSTGR